MIEEPKEDPAKRLRKLTGSGGSPLARLPKIKEPEIHEADNEAASIRQKVMAVTNQPTQLPSASVTDLKPAAVSRNSFFGPRFWTIASVISLSVNVILGLVLLVLAISLLRYGLSISSLLNMGNGLLGGLYTNFEKMDRASIQTNVSVDTTIPVKFDLQLNQTTNVVLSQDVEITNALVTMNTGGLNITRGNTSIILPQGTILPVVLNLVVPVDTTVPVTLNVPVNIPLSETQLHEPFTGLQDVVRPFYCMINSGAVNLNGEAICQ